ncbi:hypothetical protein TgHK011_004555 [Trichoderma gracile]|nr:hypothetical protein TgHK011_004555 [Trichoderma gracile]
MLNLGIVSYCTYLGLSIRSEFATSASAYITTRVVAHVLAPTVRRDTRSEGLFARRKLDDVQWDSDAGSSTENCHQTVNSMRPS